MDTLRVRVYMVRFGDAILVSVPDRAEGGESRMRHILIDVGNVLSGAGGVDTVFQSVFEDILVVLDGQPLDLYVMTHEHLDHVQGLYYAAEKLNLKLEARCAWLTASAAEGYYEKHENAKKRWSLAGEIYKSIASSMETSLEQKPPWLDALLLNNNPRSTADCVDHLRNFAEKTHYVHRRSNLKGKHPFRETRFDIWAPEEDTSDYYGRFVPMALDAASLFEAESKPTLIEPKPPPGVDAGSFYSLVNFRRYGHVENLLTIDRAANNTSIVFSLEWRDWKLLFTGDAEHRSWKTMGKHGKLEPVHFLKVSHHGSHTGTPPPELLDRIMPLSPPSDKPRSAVVSTYPDTYKDVPDRDLISKEMVPRCEVLYVERDTVPDGGYRDFEFEG